MMTKSELQDLCDDMEELISNIGEAAEEGDLKAIRQLVEDWESSSGEETGEENEGD